MLSNKQDPITEHLNNSSTSSIIHQKPPAEESPKKKVLFPNCHWLSRKDEKRAHKRNNTPCKRWGHSVILFENQMFLFGGSGNNSNARNWETIYILNCDTCEWEKVCPNDALGTNTPEPRDSHACVRIGNNMYIFGGSNGENPLNDMFAFNLVSKTWIKIDATGEIPSAREGHSGVALSDRYFFIFGGWDGKNIFQNCYLFDFITKKWKMIEYTPGTEPLPRESHSCALLNDCIYIFGGQGLSIKKKNTYYNDLFRLKINIDKSLERVTGVWTKMTSKNGLNPSPRTSHSISPYKDRFLIVIGGEGYSTNNEVMDPEEILSETKENGLKEVEETNNDESDDEHAPCFPKADIWIYDIEDSTWNLLDIKNSELFLPRFTHSCTVYKDSLIIFGGLKDLKNSIDDLMVLMLEDSETKKPIHLCSCCKKMLDSEPTDEIHPLSTGKIGFELKKVDASFDEMETDLLAECPTNSKPFISLSYLPDVSNLIKWPFACFGLLIDTALLINSKQIHIRWENKFRYSYTPNRVVLKDPSSIQSFLVFEFDGEDPNDIFSVEPTSENIFREEQTTVFYKNLKIAGLRLGESIFYVKKRGNLIELYYLSASLRNNPDLNDFIVFSCCWDVETKQIWSQSFPQFKKSILDNVSHVLSEEEILHLPSKNTFFVLNLRKTVLKKKKIFELSSKKDDICLNMPKILENTKNSKVNSVTLSLRTYLEHFFIVPSKKDFEIYLNKTKIGFNQCFSTLNEVQSFENPEILTAFSKNTKIFWDIESFDKKKANNNNNTIENEEKKIETGQNPVEELKNEEREKTLEIVKSSETPHQGHSGILIYQNNRLLQRFDEINTLPQVFGFIELDSSITLDFSKSNIENLTIRLSFLSAVNDFMRKFKEEKGKNNSKKMGLRENEIETEDIEPPVRKIINSC